MKRVIRMQGSWLRVSGSAVLMGLAACTSPAADKADTLPGDVAQASGTHSGTVTAGSAWMTASAQPSIPSPGSTLSAASTTATADVTLQTAAAPTPLPTITAQASGPSPSAAASMPSVTAGSPSAMGMPPGTAMAPEADGGVDAGGGDEGPIVPSTVFIAGDSTVSNYTDTVSTTDQAGWGQMLPEYLDERVTVDNRAIGGRTARRFIDEGYLAQVDADIVAGDTLLVQFGTNDGNKTATYTLNGQEIPYYLEPSTDFKAYLEQYIEVARAHDATLVFVTPPPRNSAYCTGGNGTGAHAEAMRELATERGVALADLNEKSVTYLKAICPAPAVEDFFLLRSDGTVDGTHFQENGARILAGFVVEGLVEAEVSIARAVK